MSPSDRLLHLQIRMQAQILGEDLQRIYGIILRIAIGRNYEQAIPLQSGLSPERHALEDLKSVSVGYRCGSSADHSRSIVSANLQLTASCAISFRRVPWKNLDKKRLESTSSIIM
jgi:hypothetical protein